MLRTFVGLAVFGVCCSASAAEMHVQRDVPYADANDKQRTLDVFAPASGKNHPIVFWIHGGGWMQGDKGDVKQKPQAFVDHGFVFVSANYPLFPGEAIKAMPTDLAKAIHWVHAHAAGYDADPNTMFVMGHSAGAQLAALLCTDPRYLQAEGLPLSIVKGCVPVDGDTYDIPLQIASVEKRIADRYRWKFGDEQNQKNLSPVTHVATGKHIPPFLVLFVADSDDTRPQTERLIKVMKDAGLDAASFGAEKSEHDKLNNGLGTGDKPSVALFEFLERTLKNAERP